MKSNNKKRRERKQKRIAKINASRSSRSRRDNKDSRVHLEKRIAHFNMMQQKIRDAMLSSGEQKDVTVRMTAGGRITTSRQTTKMQRILKKLNLN
jgi:hypothetical protein